MDQRNVKHVEEEGNAAEEGYPLCDGATGTLKERNQSDDGAQGHQKKRQRGRILGRIQEGEECQYSGVGIVFRKTPWSRIPVEIESPQHDKQNDRAEPDLQTELVALGGFENQNTAKGISGRHDSDPGYNGIENDEIWPVGTKRYGSGKECDIEDLPES